jgi:hypothetical protein
MVGTALKGGAERLTQRHRVRATAVASATHRLLTVSTATTVPTSTIPTVPTATVASATVALLTVALLTVATATHAAVATATVASCSRRANGTCSQVSHAVMQRCD